MLLSYKIIACHLYRAEGVSSFKPRRARSLLPNHHIQASYLSPWLNYRQLIALLDLQRKQKCAIEMEKQFKEPLGSAAHERRENGDRYERWSSEKLERKEGDLQETRMEEWRGQVWENKIRGIKIRKGVSKGLKGAEEAKEGRTCVVYLIAPCPHMVSVEFCETPPVLSMA